MAPCLEANRVAITAMGAKPELELDYDFNESDRLFHYTSSNGLYGILESGCLWATHYRFLNDNQEIFRAKDVIVAHVAGAILRTMAKLKVNGEVHFKDGVNLREASTEEAITVVDAMYKSTLGAPEREIAGSPGTRTFQHSVATQMKRRPLRRASLCIGEHMPGREATQSSLILIR